MIMYKATYLINITNRQLKLYNYVLPKIVIMSKYWLFTKRYVSYQHKINVVFI